MSLKVKILHIFMVSLDPTIKSPSFSWPLANLQWTRYMSLGLTTTSFISFRHMVVVQSLSHVQLFATLWTAACQASLSFTISRVCSNACSLSQWCHPTISCSVMPFSSCLRSFPASASFPVSWFFVSGGQSTGASSSVLLVNIKGWFL